MSDMTIDVAARASVATSPSIGDVVTLRGGGPRMTVTYTGPVGVAAGDLLICQWFDDQGELRQDTFALDMVQIEPRSIPAASVKLRLPVGRAAVSRV